MGRLPSKALRAAVCGNAVTPGTVRRRLPLTQVLARGSPMPSAFSRTVPSPRPAAEAWLESSRGRLPLRRRRRLHRHAPRRQPARRLHRRARHPGGHAPAARARDELLRDDVRLPARGRRARADADLHARGELPFAGHPTLGTAFVLAAPLQLGEIRIETGRGIVPVRLEREGARISSAGWSSRSLVEPFERADELLAALGLERSELPVRSTTTACPTSSSRCPPRTRSRRCGPTGRASRR